MSTTPFETIVEAGEAVGLPYDVRTFQAGISVLSNESPYSSPTFESLREKVIEYSHNLPYKIRRGSIYGVWGYYCFKFSVEQTFKQHGLPMDADDVFSKLFNTKVSTFDFAVFVLICIWLKNTITRLNYAIIKSAGSGSLHFGSEMQQLSPFDPRSTVSFDAKPAFVEYVVSEADAPREVFSFIEDPRAREEAVRRIREFKETITAVINSHSDPPKVFVELVLTFMTGMAVLVTDEIVSLVELSDMLNAASQEHRPSP